MRGCDKNDLEKGFVGVNSHGQSSRETGVELRGKCQQFSPLYYKDCTFTTWSLLIALC